MHSEDGMDDLSRNVKPPRYQTINLGNLGIISMHNFDIYDKKNVLQIKKSNQGWGSTNFFGLDTWKIMWIWIWILVKAVILGQILLNVGRGGRGI